MPELLVLGSSAAWPTASDPCSGIVLRDADNAMVIDIGTGTAGPLGEALAPRDLSAIAITHAHPDHFVDLNAVYRSRRWGGATLPSIPVIAPDEVRTALVALEPDEEAGLDELFEWRHPDAGAVQLGSWTVTAAELPHWVRDWAYRIEGPGWSAVFSGDCGPDDRLAEFAEGADILVIEATDQHQDSGGTDAFDLTATEAGRIARAAGVRRVLLTHIWPGNDRDRSRRDAERAFGGAVTVAEPGMRISIGHKGETLTPTDRGAQSV